MSISVPAPTHPLVAAAGEVESVLDSVTGVDPMYCSTTDKATLLWQLTRVLSRVSALRADVLAVAGDVAVEGIARTPGTWLAREAHLSPREAIGEERLGSALRDRWHHLADAVAAGRVTWEQARVLVGCLDDLPTDLDPELLGKAEAHLVAEAGHFGPVELRRLGRHVLEVVAPAVAEAHQLAALEAEEHRARATTRLWLRPRGDGSTDLNARLPATSPAGCGPTWTPTPAPAGSGSTNRTPTVARMSGGCRCRVGGGRRSAPCWSTSLPPGCRSTGGPRPR
jgi:hypothetical protein